MIDFPTSPAVGQTVSSGGKTWMFNGVTWDLQLSGVSPGIALSGRKNTYADLASLTPSSGDAYFVSADGQIYIYDGAAFPTSGSGIQVTRPAVGYFHAYKTGTFATSSGAAFQKVTLDTVVANSIGTWDAANNQLTVSKSGVYEANFTRSFVPSTSVQAEPHLFVNGTKASIALSSGAQFYAGTTQLLNLTAGDIISAQVYKSGVVSLTIPVEGGLRVMGPF